MKASLRPVILKPQRVSEAIEPGISPQHLSFEVLHAGFECGLLGFEGVDALILPSNVRLPRDSLHHVVERFPRFTHRAAPFASLMSFPPMGVPRSPVRG